MTSGTDSETPSPGMRTKKVVFAHFGLRRSRPPQKLEHVPPTDPNGLGTAHGGGVGTWQSSIVRGIVGGRRWSSEWSGTYPVEARGCDDQLAGICPKLAEAQARQALAERQVIEFNHRLANVLQMISTVIGRQRRVQPDPAVQDELDQLMSRVQATAALHRHLLPPRTLTHVDLGALLTKVAEAVEGVTGLICDVDAEPVYVPSQVAVHLATAVNELAWNAHKHAYGNVAGGLVNIVCRRDADARVRLSVADQGPGLPLDFDPRASAGFGLMVVCETVRDFSGELQVESHDGTRVTLLLDVPA